MRCALAYLAAREQALCGIGLCGSYKHEQHYISDGTLLPIGDNRQEGESRPGIVCVQQSQVGPGR